MEKKLLIAILITLIILGGAILFVLLQSKYLNKTTENITPTITSSVTPTVQVTTLPSISPTKIDNTQKDTEDIRALLAAKHSKSVIDTIVSVSKNTGTHAQGGIKFAGEESGAGWFAAKDSNGQWVIVYDGQGVIPCDDIEPYSFPKDMIPECWDEVTQKNVIR